MNTRAQSIGVIGFGVMGQSMARNLAKAGFRIFGYSRTQSKVERLAEEGIIPTTLQTIAKECSTILLSVTDGAAVGEILFGDNGIVSLLQANDLIIDTSTIAPSEAKELYAQCTTREIRFVDAPVTGGDVGARNGTLTIMCGATEEGMTQARPILEKIGKKIVHVGAPGLGQMMKAVNQIGVALGIVAMTEALLFAEKQGINSSVALDVLQSGAAGSWALSNYAPRVLSGDLKPGFDAAHMLKDLRIALTEVDGLLNLPGTALTTQLFERLVNNHAGLGNHALIKAYTS